MLALGTNLDGNSCSNAGQTGNNCVAAFLGLHLTPASSAYLEVSSLSSEMAFRVLIIDEQGTWVWLADHSLDPPFNELEAYSGRGIYSQSAGPVWMIGTGELHDHALADVC